MTINMDVDVTNNVDNPYFHEKVSSGPFIFCLLMI
jgi:hypothetical protein